MEDKPRRNTWKKVAGESNNHSYSISVGQITFGGEHLKDFEEGLAL